jgi:hypothetical protein
MFSSGSNSGIGGDMENNFVITGDITTIFLKSKEGRKFQTIIETDDLPKVMEFTRTWCAAVRENPRTRLRITVTGGHGMSRWLLNPPPTMHVDHINRDALDNRRSNLRICTAAENYRNKSVRTDNKSGTPGVSWNGKKWAVIITVSGKVMNLGRFKNIEDAITLRKEAEDKYFGEFAPKR